MKWPWSRRKPVQEVLKCPCCGQENPYVSVPFFSGTYRLDVFRAEHTIMKNVLCKACGCSLAMIFRLDGVQKG